MIQMYTAIKNLELNNYNRDKYQINFKRTFFINTKKYFMHEGLFVILSSKSYVKCLKLYKYYRFSTGKNSKTLDKMWKKNSPIMCTKEPDIYLTIDFLQSL